ncbi:MAG TPA: hypothetical protein VKE98_01015 [Gemmataceae bacterium]|nr:hypothetical protein [Gemmataceae bacterium]
MADSSRRTIPYPDEATRAAAALEEQRRLSNLLSARTKAMKEANRPLTLLGFLQVLLCHHQLTTSIEAERAIQTLRNEWPTREFTVEEIETGQAACTQEPVTPWCRIADKLIGMCQVAIDRHFLCEWIARESEFEKWDPRAAELARLDFGRVQDRLLSELRKLFPAQAADWFECDTNTSRAGKGASRRRGRQPDTDAKKDECIHNAWHSGNYKKYEELALALGGLSARDVERAIDRHRKRIKVDD